LIDAIQQIHKHELLLASALSTGLNQIPGLTLYGPSIDATLRAPTLAFTMDGCTPEEVCKHLGAKGIYAWDGHFYAIRAVEVLDLLEKGGVTRMGVVAYNTQEEVERTIAAVAELAHTISANSSVERQETY